MLSSLKKVFDRISNFGIVAELEFPLGPAGRALNRTLAATAIALIAIIILDISYYNVSPLYSLSALGLTLFTLLLKYYGHNFIADLLYTTLFPTLLFFISILYGENLNINYVFFAFVIIIFLAFENKWLKGFLSAYILILQITAIYYTRYYGSIYPTDSSYLLDGILILILPALGVSLLVTNQVTTINNLYNEQVKINKELNVKNKALSKSNNQNETKNHLLAIIAHDLKGPASSFNDLTKNIAYLIKEERPDRLLQLAPDFELAGNRLYNTISNLLNWVTSQRGILVSTISSIDLKHLLDKVVNDLSYQMDFKKVTISYKLGNTVKIDTDWNMLKIILLNILNNAIKFSPPNDKIIVKHSSDSKFDTIDIIDNGNGISVDKIEKILSEEFISSPGTLHEKGHGIGLSICFTLIHYLGGKITINSKEGEGTVFGIHIPKTIVSDTSKAHVKHK